MIIKRKLYSNAKTKAVNKAIRKRLRYKKAEVGKTLYKDAPVGIMDSINSKACVDSLTVGANLGRTAVPGHSHSLKYYKKRSEYGDRERLQKIWDHGKLEEYSSKDRIEDAKDIMDVSRRNKINAEIRKKQIEALTK